MFNLVRFTGRNRNRNLVRGLIILAAIFVLPGCTSTKPAQNNNQAPPTVSSQPTPGQVLITVDFERLSRLASNQFAIWIEDEKGNYVKTLFATNFTARGGYKNRPQSLPEWRTAAKWDTASTAEIDAVSKATPQSGPVAISWDCTDRQGNPVAPGTYTYRIEGNNYYEDIVTGRGQIMIGQANNASAAKLEFHAPSQDRPETIIKNVQVSFVPSAPSKLQ